MLLNIKMFPFPRRRRLEGHSLWVRYKKNWGRGFILLLHQAAVLPGQMLAVTVLTSIGFCHPKPSDLVLHVVPEVCGTL